MDLFQVTLPSRPPVEAVQTLSVFGICILRLFFAAGKLMLIIIMTKLGKD